VIEYSQFCPLAKAAEVLGEKWALLIVRELVLGATRFTQIQRGIPRISPTVLNARLAELTERGVIMRRRIPEQKGYEYRLTESGRELYPLLLKISEWGMRWARSGIGDEELDVEFLMGDIRRRIDPGKLPDGRTVLKFTYTDLEDFAEWWVKISGRDIELCLDDPGHEVDVFFTTDLRTMTEVWMGDLPLKKAQADRRLKIVGPSTLLRNLRSWFPLHMYADIRPGRLAEGRRGDG
jgi:DNA-binding HxlR family transcriptional regulator